MHDSKTTIQQDDEQEGVGKVRSFRCSDDLWATIRKTAIDRGVTTQDLVIEALSAFLGAARA